MKYKLQNNKMQQTRPGKNGASLLILVFDGRTQLPRARRLRRRAR